MAGPRQSPSTVDEVAALDPAMAALRWLGLRQGRLSRLALVGDAP